MSEVRPTGRRLLALLIACTSAPSVADWEDSLRYESADERFSVRLGGRLHGDVADIEGDAGGAQDDVRGEWRRARLNLSGKLFDDWRYRFEYDFAADEDSRIKDAWIGYQGFDRVRIRAGNLQEPVSLEELSSSNATTFMERALPNALVPGYRLGLLADTWGDAWGAALGVFEGSIQRRDEDDEEGWAVAARGHYAPIDRDGNLLHLGASLEYREPPGDERVSFGSLPEIHLSDRRLVSTGTLSDVDHTLTGGLELAAGRGPLSLQGEYLAVSVQRTPREDVIFGGWYLQGSWFLYGGQRAYDSRDGTFELPRPRGKLGAWELAARYSELDLQDGPITGGEERNWTLGLNWYVNRNTRVMANWVDGTADPSSDGDREHVSAIQARLQFVF